MLVARTLQAIAILALVGATFIALDARETVTERISGMSFTVARWNAGTLFFAGQAALAALILLGLGSGLADLRLIREAGERIHAASVSNTLMVMERRELRLRRSDPPHDIAARVLAGHSAGTTFTAGQIAEVADAVEGRALRDGSSISRMQAEQEALRVLTQVWRGGAAKDD